MEAAQSLISTLIITIAACFSVMVLGANLGRLLNVASSFFYKARDVIFSDTRRR